MARRLKKCCLPGFFPLSALIDIEKNFLTSFGDKSQIVVGEASGSDIPFPDCFSESDSSETRNGR
jgi:hypothetical protein